jgi:hypothetical protein
MKLQQSIPVQIGRVTARVYGGPIKDYVLGTRRLWAIKMAEEIEHPCDFVVNTRDFSVPDPYDLDWGLIYAVKAIFQGKDVYAGCLGGTGRTGLFMGCLVKCLNDYASLTGGDVTVPIDPVAYVRHHYRLHAIETKEQEAFVRGYDSTEVVHYLIGCMAVKEVIKTVEVVKTVYPPFWSYLYWLVTCREPL